ncbi:MAG TPA: amidohydrolase family protein [Xanthobacteraceae bacterium]|nr:amidohydrolase family protein [Xanthobacteraceae bacterium]
MLTRRRILSGITAAGAAGLVLKSRAGFAAAPSTVKTPVAFDVPRGACDCHVHIFDPVHFPYFSGRLYTPPEASIEDLLALQNALHFDRLVVVTPSVYGIDNSCMVNAVRTLGSRARGVAVIDQTVSADAIDEMAKAGVRGVRLNFETAGESNPDNARRVLLATAKQLAGRNWHIQINTHLSVISALKDDIMGLSMPVIFDHFGGAKGEPGTGQPGFSDLVDLIKSGHAYVKISAPYRPSTHPPDFPEAAPLARALVAANNDRVVWGSNWPHPGRGPSPLELAPPYPNDDGRVLNLLPTWVPDAAIRKRILVDNPARLYGFEPIAG